MSPRTVHPIERRSYEILRSRADTSSLPPLTRAVAERIVHTSADLGYLDDLVADEEHLARGLAALDAGAPIVSDVVAVTAAVTTRRVHCLLLEPGTVDLAHDTGLTRSAAGVRRAAERFGAGAVWVVGNAPTALVEVIASAVEPALVIGLPVGFVGSVESKAELRASGLSQVSNRSEKGGSMVAAAAVNALLYALLDR